MCPVKAKWVTIKIRGKMSGRRSLERDGKACHLATGEAKEPEAVNHTRIQLTLSVKKNLAMKTSPPLACLGVRGVRE